LKNLIKSFALTLIIFIVVGCGGNDPGELKVETVKEGKLIADFPANFLKEELLKKGLITKDSKVFGYKAYKIPYTTTDEEGKKVKASGVMVVPTNYNTDNNTSKAYDLISKIGFAMVLDCHGTIFSNNEAPSVEIENSAMPKGSSVIFSALSGFITLQPDYIGFGASKNHYHPYLLKKSSAQSTIDFLKAALSFAQINNINIIASKDLYLTGYSQGGFVALATLKKIEETNEFNIKLTIPMAGPYFLDPIAQSVLNSQEIAVPSFMAATAYAYSKAYNKDVGTLIQEPYASKLPTLFSGKYTRVQIDKELTTKVSGEKGLFTQDIVSNYEGSWFQEALKQNSVVNFSPQTPVKLLQCKGDTIIPYAISQNAYNVFTNMLGSSSVELMSPVEVILTNDPNTDLRYNHSECGAYAYSIAAKIFANVRKQTIGY